MNLIALEQGFNPIYKSLIDYVVSWDENSIYSELLLVFCYICPLSVVFKKNSKVKIKIT